MAVKIRIVVFWIMTPCSLVVQVATNVSEEHTAMFHRNFGNHFYSEDRGDVFL
jgi:hypothetical protein